MIDLRLVKIVVIVKVHRSHWDITVLILPHPVIAVLAFKRKVFDIGYADYAKGVLKASKPILSLLHCHIGHNCSIIVFTTHHTVLSITTTQRC